MHADDDPEDRWLFLESINGLEENISLTQFEDGADLLIYLDQLAPEQHPVCAIVSDMQMPLMGGISLLQVIKKLPHWKDVPFIIFSTSSFREDVDRCQKHGADAFFTKPSTFLENKTVISQIIALCRRHTPHHQLP